MLNRLYIKNFAIIDELEIEFDCGFNVFTGQTGAGKSLIIGAIEFLLGLRGGGNLIGKGSASAIVSGEFDLADKELIRQVSQVSNVPIEDGELIIQRRINSSRKVSTSINSVPVSTSVLKQVGELLVDIHGQHENQFLLRPVNQLRLLDAYASSLKLADEFSAIHRRWQELIVEKNKLFEQSELRAQQIELYEFQLNEIEQADLYEDELSELENRYKQMSNIEKLRELAGAVVNMLEEGECPISNQLGIVYKNVQELALLDDKLENLPNQVEMAITELDDITHTLSRYADNPEYDSEEFAKIDERLTLINRLMKKYGDGEYERIFRYRDEIAEKLEKLRHEENDFREIDKRIDELQTKRTEIGRELSEKRKKAAVKLVREINRHLRELAMPNARFGVRFIEPEEGRYLACGFESVEFMIRTNPGYPEMSLRKIASGGELSRIMLAIKSILARADRSCVLVFDEVDSNVGGRLGEIIGRKLFGLAKKQQVICISHLPQIAAFADRHFVVRKRSSGSDTVSSVTVVAGEERIREIAEMISGDKVTETTIKQAEEMLRISAASRC